MTKTDDSDHLAFLKSLFDAIPSVVLVVDEDVRVLGYNRAAAALLQEGKQEILKRRGGEILHCIHAGETPEGCGHALPCRDCIIRNTVKKAFDGRSTARRRTRLELVRGDQTVEIYALITASPFEHNDEAFVVLVVEDISDLIELQRIVPICLRCKKVRTDDKYWMQVDEFFKRQWDLDFSHGYCPECARLEMQKMNEEWKKTQ